jgi:hypothetical protein
MKKNQWVVKTGDGWGVRGEGNSRLTSEHGKQSEAYERARQIAKNEKAEVIVQGRDGKIINRNSFGNDPFPPRDKKH